MVGVPSLPQEPTDWKNWRMLGATDLRGRGEAGGCRLWVGTQEVPDLQRVQVPADLADVHPAAGLCPPAWRAAPGKRDITTSPRTSPQAWTGARRGGPGRDCSSQATAEP